MINIVFIGIYIILLYKVYTCFKKRNYWALVMCLLLFLTFSPMMQYVYFPEYKLDATSGTRFLGFARVWLEYVHVILQLVILAHIPGRNRGNKSVVYFAFFYLILNALQFFTALDVTRSFNGYIVSVVNPTIFCLIVNKVLSNYAFSTSKITKGLFKYYFVVMAFFYIISVFNFFRGGTIIEADNEGLFIYGLGSGFGIFRDRILMTELFFFLAIIFTPRDRTLMNGISRPQFILFILGSMIMLILCNSRTMYVSVAFLVLLLTVFNPFNNRKSLLGMLALAFIFMLVVNSISSGMDITEIIFSRFHNKGATALESASEDERYLIWETAKEYAARTNYIGIGIGNFATVYSRGYSNAHSLYYSVLVERGMLVLVWLLLTLVTLIVKSYRKFRKEKNTLFLVVLLGVLLYSIISYTGEELFNVSQVAYSLSPYFIFLMLSLCYTSNITEDENIHIKNI